MDDRRVVAASARTARTYTGISSLIRGNESSLEALHQVNQLSLPQAASERAGAAKVVGAVSSSLREDRKPRVEEVPGYDWDG